MTFDHAPLTYDGTEQTVSVTGVTLNGVKLTGNDYSVSGDLKGTDVGDYTVTVTGVGNVTANYKITYEVGTLTVAKVPVYIATGFTAGNKTYDGSTTATVTGAALLKRISDDGEVDGLSVSGIAAAFTDRNVGTGKAVTITAATLSDTGNYALDIEKSNQALGLTANITAKPVTITGLSAANKTYDGNTDATVTGVATIHGKVDGDDISVGAGKAAFADANAGTGKTVTFSGYSLVGSTAKNYRLSAQHASVSADITAKAVGLSWSNTSFTYDGNRHQPTATATGLVLGDTCAVTVTGAQTNAGSYTATATALSNPSYKLPEMATQAFVIRKAAPGVTPPTAVTGLIFTGGAHRLVNAGKAEGGKIQYALGTETEATGPYTTSIPTGTDAGTYYVWYRVVGDANHNDVAPARMTVEIGKAGIAPTVRITGWTYGETPNAPSVSKNPGNGAVTYTYSDSADGKFKKKVPVNAGIWYVKARVAKTDNYLGATTDATRFVIARAVATVTADSLSKAKGEADPTLTATVTGLVNGDDESVIIYTLKREAGEKIGIYVITPRGKAEQGNYAVTYVEGMFTITGKAEPEDMMLAKLTASGDRALKLSWTKMKGAEGYDVFFSRCGGTLRRRTTVRKGTSVKLTGLKKRIAYKASVRAWKKVKGVKTYIGEASPIVHAITAGYDGQYTNAKKVTVRAPKVKLAIGMTSVIQADVKAVKSGRELLAHGNALRYYSSNRSVATVTSTGIIRARGAGSCTVTVMANDGVRASVKVTVPDTPSKIRFKKQTYSVKQGKTLNLANELKLKPSGATNGYTWSSCDPDIATVKRKGVVKGLQPGKAIIVVHTSNGKMAYTTVNVKQ